jgi:hypothetical protein
VHDESGCYLAKLFSSPYLTLFSVYNRRLGVAVVQQARLEGMVERKIIFPYLLPVCIITHSIV